MKYEYRIVDFTNYNTVKEFLEVVNLYGEEGFHIIEALGEYSTRVIMQKEEKVIHVPVE